MSGFVLKVNVIFNWIHVNRDSVVLISIPTVYVDNQSTLKILAKEDHTHIE